ncbi:unnamed protein product [Amaranthus hypochondriacus]
MSCTNTNFLPLILLLIACFTSWQAAARHLPQMDSLNFSPEHRLPAFAAPFYHKKPARLTFRGFQEPLIPPHFLPILPFPSLPTFPTFPTPTAPSLPSMPMPTGPTIPSFPSEPNPGNPNNVPPAFPNPPAKTIKENPSKTPRMMKP